MKKKNNGHSLLELLTVICIAGILIGLAVPGLGNLKSNQASDHLKKTVMLMLGRAQQLAHVAKTSVGICHSQDARQCTAESARYLLMFYDKNNDGSIQSVSQLIETLDLPGDSGRLRWVSYPSYRYYIQFRPAFAYFTDNGRIGFYRHGVDKPIWELVINQAGNVRESV